ncbi:MAG: OmpP1/FadL family transporter, partial [Fidelibacterota bacterium]
KKGNVVISGGFEPIGGGGGAVYEDGLPSFETEFTDYIGLPAAALNVALAPYGNITGYSLDVNFEGSSVYYGGQIGLTYGLNDMLSIAAGMRYVYAKNNYEGYLKNIALKADGGIGDIVGIASDMEVNAVQTGSGITGIFGLNVTPSDMLNIGVRYETLTKLELKNDTEVDDTDMFPDGQKTNADMPAMLALGVSFKPIEKLRAEFDLNYYVNTSVDWDWATRDTMVGTTAEDFLGNGYEIGLAVEYCLSEKLLASVGFSYGDGSVKDDYQTDLSYSLPSTTIGLGIAYKVSDNLLFNFGALNTFYQDGSRDGQRKNALTGVPVDYTEKYAKTNYGFAFGIDYKF